jgi:hypothetical protein
MKIQPFKLIVSGVGPKTATDIFVLSQFDDLVNEVSFQVNLKGGEEDLVACAVVLKGDTYKAWDASELGAYQACADALGLELV